MPRVIAPALVAKPASAYAQGIVHSGGAERLLIAGQIGITPDGTILEGAEAQMEQAWQNLFAVLRAAGFERKHLVRLTVYVTDASLVGLYRTVRDRFMEGHLVAMTFLVVQALAAPKLVFEVDGEAVRE